VRGRTRKLARYALGYGVPVLAAVALLLAGIARTSRPLYVAGVLACAVVLGGAVASWLPRRGRGRWSRWVGGLLAAVIVVAAGLGLPWWALQRSYNGDPVWTVPYRATWSAHHGDHVFLADGDSALALDRRTGRVLGRAPHGGDPRLLGGAGFGLTFGGGVAAYDGSARPLWEQLRRRYEEVSMVAATDKTTVLESCRAGVCRLKGVGSDGRTRWSRPSVNLDAATPAYSHSPSRTRFPDSAILPEVVVGRADPNTWTVTDADDGRLLRRVSVAGPHYVGAAGETVVVSDRAGGYRFRGMRGGRLVWTVSLPAGASPDGDEPAAPMLLFPTRMYARVGGGRGVTVDLKSGDHRAMDLDPLAETVAASDEVLVTREGRRVRGLEASSGRALWEMEAPGWGAPGMDAGSGAVVLLTRPSGNPLLPEEVRRNGELVTVLDALTGRPTGRLVRRYGVWEALPVGTGQALVVSGRATRLIGTATASP
jgi:hypothetical protein